MNTTVRTPEHPMAFTSVEFWLGAWTAWGLFLAFLPALIIISSLPELFTPSAGFIVVAIIYGLVIGGFVSLVAMLVFSPLAWLLGYCLRRTADRWIHVLAFTTLGAAVGFVTFAAWTLLAYAQITDALISWPNWSYAAGSAVAVALGWWRASRRALERDDLRSEYPPTRLNAFLRRSDGDAQFEDFALDS
ncbi:hypothetical protein [Microbacterium alcoholitolerans]|uniref:hypothetical protein n=1 Tax=unclassified Microbacterium TaxID=2609290 RepID=UPI003D169BF1